MKIKKIEKGLLIQGNSVELSFAFQVKEAQEKIKNFSDNENKIIVGIAKKIYTKMRKSNNPQIRILLPEISNAISQKDMLYLTMMIKNMKTIASQL
jgi:hypothetical protein